MRKTRIPPWVLAACAVIVLWSVPLPVRAQCSMCSATVANSAEGQQAARSINAGILVLLVPPVSMMCLIFVVAVRRRNPNGEDSDERSFRGTGFRRAFRSFRGTGFSRVRASKTRLKTELRARLRRKDAKRRSVDFGV